MTGAELGFLLLGSHMGDYDRPCLTPVQLEQLRQKMQIKSGTRPGEGYVDRGFLASLGYDEEMGERILGLLSQTALARAYIQRARQAGYGWITMASAGYPVAFRNLLGNKAPAILWYRGDPALLKTPAIALVGSRNATEQALEFAATAGLQAALQGYTLVSGGAKGCDRAGQESCLSARGQVICIIADTLGAHRQRNGQLLLCEDSYDLPFSSTRALSRNLLIHTLGQVVLVAQCGDKGGTWSGTTQNLRHGWRPVCFNREDRSIYPELVRRGATPIGCGELSSFGLLANRQLRLF